MGKQPTLAEVRERCHAMGITPGRSVSECLRRIDAAAPYGPPAHTAVDDLAKVTAYLRRARRVELMTRSLTGYVTVAWHLATVRR